MKVPSFFLSLQVHFSTPFNRSQASLFRYHSSYSQIWYLCNKPRTPKENKGKTSYSDVPTRQTTEGTDDVLETRFMIQAGPRHQNEVMQTGL